jgi:hypothetical protein
MGRHWGLTLLGQPGPLALRLERCQAPMSPGPGRGDAMRRSLAEPLNTYQGLIPFAAQALFPVSRALAGVTEGDRWAEDG